MEATKLIIQRFSPVAFSDKEVSDTDIQKFLEAARWAPSAFNEQPWRFVITTKQNETAYNKLSECLVEGNRAWAKAAPVLMLVCAKRNFTHNNRPNDYHQFDTGMAVQNFLLSAFESGVYVHQMAGFDHDLVRKKFEIPEEYSILTMAAIGHLGNVNILPTELQERAKRPRTRKPVSDLLFQV